jgi:hypothetical protein
VAEAASPERLAQPEVWQEPLALLLEPHSELPPVQLQEPVKLRVLLVRLPEQPA